VFSIIYYFILPDFEFLSAIKELNNVNDDQKIDFLLTSLENFINKWNDFIIFNQYIFSIIISAITVIILSIFIINRNLITEHISMQDEISKLKDTMSQEHNDKKEKIENIYETLNKSLPNMNMLIKHSTQGAKIFGDVNEAIEEDIKLLKELHQIDKPFYWSASPDSSISNSNVDETIIKNYIDVLKKIANEKNDIKRLHILKTNSDTYQLLNNENIEEKYILLNTIKALNTDYKTTNFIITNRKLGFAFPQEGKMEFTVNYKNPSSKYYKEYLRYFELLWDKAEHINKGKK
jgi:hypothetical protein